MITVLLFFDSKLWWLLALVVSFSPHSTAGFLTNTEDGFGHEKAKSQTQLFPPL